MITISVAVGMPHQVRWKCVECCVAEKGAELAARVPGRHVGRLWLRTIGCPALVAHCSLHSMCALQLVIALTSAERGRRRLQEAEHGRAAGDGGHAAAPAPGLPVRLHGRLARGRERPV